MANTDTFVLIVKSSLMLLKLFSLPDQLTNVLLQASNTHVPI